MNFPLSFGHSEALFLLQFEKPRGRPTKNPVLDLFLQLQFPHCIYIFSNGSGAFSRIRASPGEILRIICGKNQPLRTNAKKGAAQSSQAPLKARQIEVEHIKIIFEWTLESAKAVAFGHKPILDRRDAAAKMCQDKFNIGKSFQHSTGDDSSNRSEEHTSELQSQSNL